MMKSPSKQIKNSHGPVAKKAFVRSMIQASLGSVVVFSVADQNPIYCVLAILGILAAWAFSVRPQQPAPRIAINSFLLLVIAIAGIELLRVGVGVSSFAEFAALLLIVKMLDLRDPRDEGQILVLSVAILIAAVLTSNTLMTGFLTVIVIILIMRAVVLFQIHSVLALAKNDEEIINKKARVDFRSMLIATGFICAVIGSVVFVILPRNIGMQPFGQWGDSGGSVSGFSDSVELGRPGLISQSSTPVLDLLATDTDGQNIGSSNSPAIYLRGAVLNNYTDGNWESSLSMRNPLSNRIRLVPANTSLVSRNDVADREWDRQLDISVRSTGSGQRLLFSPWKTVEFRTGSEPMRIGLSFERGLFLRDGIGGRIDYVARSKNVEFNDIDFSSFSSRNEVLDTIVEPEVAQLARDIVSQGGVNPDPLIRPIANDQAAIRLIENHLRTQYSYTLDSQPVPNGEDATKWFLFERKTGHCEYYASALTLMSRSIGIPARLITGYVASDFNEVTGQYVVRESNAHAWIEAEIAPGEWRTFDGTPPQDFHQLHQPDPTFWRSVTKMYESLEFLWVRSVVAYDSDSQRSIMGTPSSDFGMSKLGESLLNRFAAGRSRLIQRGFITAIIVFASSMFVGILILRYKDIWDNALTWIGSYFASIRRRVLPERRISGDPRVELLDQQIRNGLVRLGIPKPDWKPLKMHIDDHVSELELAAGNPSMLYIEASEMLYRLKFSQDHNQIDAQILTSLGTRLRSSEKS
ncbi:MAG: DUF3488 and transglutaminase-like domain-containing protein [Phycisphaerales bacterium]|nr:DUF3488 and transglutaminase-like domain-containing protein [Phycisphaerales bacterium]